MAGLTSSDPTPSPSAGAPTPSAPAPSPLAAPERFPRIIYDLARPTAPGAPPGDAAGALTAVHALLSASELGSSPATDVRALLPVLLPGISSTAPVLAPLAERAPPRDVETVMAWVSSAVPVFNELATAFGPNDLPGRAVATSRALDVALSWVGSLAESVRLLEHALRTQAGAHPGESHPELLDTISALEEERATLEQETAKQTRVRTALEREKAVLEGQLRRGRSRLESANTRIAELERRLASSVGDRATVSQFLVDAFEGPTCPAAALRYLVHACAQRDRSVASDLALVAVTLPGRTLPAHPIEAPLPPMPARDPRPVPEPESGVSTEPASPGPVSGGAAAGDDGDSEMVDYGDGAESDATVNVEDTPGDVDMTASGALGGRGRPLESSAESPGSKRQRSSPRPASSLGAGGAELDALAEAIAIVSGSSTSVSGPTPAVTGSTPATPTPSTPTVTSTGPAPAPPAPAPAPPAPQAPQPPRPGQPPAGLFQLLVTPQANNLTLLQLPPIPASATLAERYAVVRGSEAYRAVVPIAAGLPLRRGSRFALTPTDLSFTEIDVMGVPPATRKVMGRWEMQVDRPNTRGYPDTIVRRTQSDAAFRSFRNFREHYLDLVDTRPWEEMWRGRVTRLYLLDPALLDAASENWLLRVFEFMYAHRQALWERLHWLHMPKRKNLHNPGAVAISLLRDRLSDYLSKAHEALLKLRPATWPKAFNPLYNLEPAFWILTQTHCTWMPDLDDAALDRYGDGETMLYDQLEALDEEEPLRIQFGGGHIKRFVTTFDPRGQRVFALHHSIGASWSVPAPWNDPNFVPIAGDDEPGRFAPTLGTPGPAFFRPDDEPELAGVWRSTCGSFGGLLTLYDRDDYQSIAALRNRLTGPLLFAEPGEGGADDAPQTPGRPGAPIEIGDDRSSENSGDGDYGDEDEEQKGGDGATTDL